MKKAPPERPKVIINSTEGVAPAPPKGILPIPPVGAFPRRIPENSFLRFLPLHISNEDATAYSFFVNLADSICGSYTIILDEIVRNITDIPNINGISRSNVFTHSWNIIYSFHALKEICKASKCLKGVLSYFDEIDEPSILRNKMNHIHMNIGNISKSNLVYGSMSGSISCLYDMRKNNSLPENFRTTGELMFTLGQLSKGTFEIYLTDAPPFNAAISHVVLNAFKLSTNLSILASISSTVSRQIEDYLRNDYRSTERDDRKRRAPIGWSMNKLKK